ncbi:ribbon-helix-helix DNA binding domain protein [Gordonia phage Denise]|uniref:Ribbon-helix-helix DNA binding domain protein n=1 Tax=Gordonia phage Denise TaxID=2652879 RepID=A0A5P8DCB6_9CAUD|nr:ribbon-helix-helix DNA binding domain protein [Gordonia phage Denise]QFP96644.1 ribbon-helix-helix DNA binding domain protein [Gordonia phage Denise]
MPPRGRPVSTNPKANVTSVRLTDEEHRLCQKAADAAGQTLGAWMRAKVVNAAKRAPKDARSSG